MSKLLRTQYAKILYHITKELSGKELDAAVTEFFQLLKKHQMLKKIDDIVEAFLDYAKRQEGIDKITITSAHKLPSKLIHELASKFSDHFEVDERVGQEVLGGVVIRKGNTVYDASARAYVESLRNIMKS